MLGGDPSIFWDVRMEELKDQWNRTRARVHSPHPQSSFYLLKVSFAHYQSFQNQHISKPMWRLGEGSCRQASALTMLQSSLSLEAFHDPTGWSPWQFSLTSNWPCCDQTVGPETSWTPLQPELLCDSVILWWPRLHGVWEAWASNWVSVCTVACSVI